MLKFVDIQPCISTFLLIQPQLEVKNEKLCNVYKTTHTHTSLDKKFIQLFLL